VHQAVVGVVVEGLLRDWELIKLLNPLADRPRSQVLAAETGTEKGVIGFLAAAQQHVQSHLDELDLPFKLPTVERFACLVPGTAEMATPRSSDESTRTESERALFALGECPRVTRPYELQSPTTRDIDVGEPDSPSSFG
jgi:hypothetical protein